jgi:hypothetical protein
MPAVIHMLASDMPLEDNVARVVEVEIENLSRAPYLPGYILSELAHHPERLRQLLAAVTRRTPEDIQPLILTKLRAQLDAGARGGAIRSISAMLGMDDRTLDEFISRRRRDLTSFFLGALRP